jgi:GTP pyrophosphokinase
VARLSSDALMTQVAAELKYPTIEALYVAIGEGHVSPQSVVSRVVRLVSEDLEEEAEEIPAARPVKLSREPIQSVVVQGRSDVWVKLSRCCTPVPGDEIVGFITRGHGVSVHRTDCPNVADLQRRDDRFIDVSWKAGRPTSFLVSVKVEGLDRIKLLRDVATVLGDQHVNIVSASSNTAKDRVATFRFTFELADIAHLSSILQAVKRVDGVFDAYRVVPG